MQGAKVVVKPLYDSAQLFSGGLAWVGIGSIQAYIDKTGAFIGDPFKGRAIVPANAVQEVWQGTTTTPNGDMQETFFLIREGSKIKGYYSSSGDWSAWASVDVSGETQPGGAVHLASDNGLEWKGQFRVPVLIAGTRPNGPAGSGAPEFPLRLRFMREPNPGEVPPVLQPTATDWDAFLARFKDAIRQRDLGYLSGAIGRNFSLQNENVRSIGDVFGRLNWQQVEAALNSGMVIARQSSLGRQKRIAIDEHPCPNCVYQVAVSFVQDADSQWRWTGVSYPGD